jgi:DNA mismatch endonuclease (patch repair protein)
MVVPRVKRCNRWQTPFSPPSLSRHTTISRSCVITFRPIFEEARANASRMTRKQTCIRDTVSDVFSTIKRSKVMAAIRSKGNKGTELKLALIFRTYGIRGWRKHLKLPGTPDFAFPKRRLAVFVDGCFWHGCPWHGHKPNSNRVFWRRKLDRNKARDKRVTKALRRAGWHVLRIWEHQLVDAARVAARTKNLLRKKPLDLKGTKI